MNNRDLAKLDVDLETFERVADATADLPDDITLIAESGVSTAADVRRMRAAGADALLIGSAIMNYEAGADPAATVRTNTERLTTAESRDADDAGPDGSANADATPERNQ